VLHFSKVTLHYTPVNAFEPTKGGDMVCVVVCNQSYNNAF
jgi:hypothetical protein